MDATLDVEIRRLRRVIEEARPYCTRLGVYTPRNPEDPQWVPHHECSPEDHVLVIEAETL